VYYIVPLGNYSQPVVAFFFCPSVGGRAFGPPAALKNQGYISPLIFLFVNELLKIKVLLCLLKFGALNFEIWCSEF